MAVNPDSVLNDVVRIATETLGDRLLAGYAMGSLAHGGFAPAVSDVDVALILTDPLAAYDAAALQRVGDAVRDLDSPLHARTSIFWGSPASLRGGGDDGRFPPLDRLCLFEHGRLLCGHDIRDGLQPPDVTELTVAGARFAADLLAENMLATAGQPADLLERGVRPATKLVLFPARFLFTADTGREGTNDAAVRHYSVQHTGQAADLVAAAFTWRTTAPGPEAPGLLTRGFVPLYDDYLADHIARLDAAGEPELAQRFRDWRARLPAVGTPSTS